MVKKGVKLTLLLAMGLITACQQQVEQTTESRQMAPQPVQAATTAGSEASVDTEVKGRVVESMVVAGYTYARVETEGDELWAAGPQTAMAVGDTVVIDIQHPMYNFHSNAMNRDFEVLYFVDGFDGSRTSAKARPAVAAATPTVTIGKLEGGYTIAEALAQRSELAGKPIRIRGQVTKYTGGVMGKNWIHIVDGSGNDDLVITTTGTTNEGDVIVVDGALTLNRDFGFGYVYDVIMEDAVIKND